ncbi:MAG: cytochrome c [Myxococcales bacterium]|nr:cytochrome c [Myxococcales bacterium]
MTHLRTALALLLAGCGTSAPSLPAEAPIAALPGDAGRGERLVADRGLGRSGLACGDCHGGPDTLRPATPLGALSSRPTWWWGTAPTLGAAVQRCVERSLLRPALDAQALGDVVAALEAAAGAPGRAWPADATPAATYDLACRHCHEDGPGGPLLDRTWPTAFLRDRIRGTDRPPHPDTLMPAFDAERLPDAALTPLAEALGSGRLAGLWRPGPAPATVPSGGPGRARGLAEIRWP